MSTIKIVVASNGQNLALAKRFKETLDAKGAANEIIDLVDMGLPLYTPSEQKNGIPAKIEALVSDIAATEKFIFVAPEYNGGVPPTLTNFIAWLSVSGDDWRACFNGKVAALATASGGGGQHVLMGLRTQLAYIGMNTIGRQIVSTFKNPAKDASIEAVCNSLIS